MTFVNETPVAIFFSVIEKSNIPSNGVDHGVSVAILPFEAEISYAVIPRIEHRVYIFGGPVGVILDDSYFFKTSMSVSTFNAFYTRHLSQLPNAGKDFDFTLGDDAALKVAYSCTARTVKSDMGFFRTPRHALQ